MDQHVEIGRIGDFDPDLRCRIATNEALEHTAGALSISRHPSWISTPLLASDTVDAVLPPFHDLWCAPGVYKSMDGAFLAARLARERRRPFIET